MNLRAVPAHPYIPQNNPPVNFFGGMNDIATAWLFHSAQKPVYKMPRQSRWMVLLYGEPRLWREALKQSLTAALGKDAVHEYFARDLPTEFLARAQIDWLVAFFPVNSKLEPLLQRVAQYAPQTNVLLLSGDGAAIVRWSDRVELRRSDISLEEVVGILHSSAPLA